MLAEKGSTAPTDGSKHGATHPLHSLAYAFGYHHSHALAECSRPRGEDPEEVHLLEGLVEVLGSQLLAGAQEPAGAGIPYSLGGHKAGTRPTGLGTECSLLEQAP